MGVGLHLGAAKTAVAMAAKVKILVDTILWYRCLVCDMVGSVSTWAKVRV